MLELINLQFFKNIHLLFDMKRLIPDKRCNSILDLPRTLQGEKDIRGLIFDVDQTILPYGKSLVSKPIGDKISVLKQKYACCLLSNYPIRSDKIERLKAIEKQLEIPAAKTTIKKPDQAAFSAAVRELDLKKEEIAIVGDRVLTDIVGGNSCGLLTILVEPLNPRNDPFWLVRIPRFVERLLLNIVSTILRKGRRNEIV